MRATLLLIKCSFYINLPIGGVAMLVLLFFYHTPAHANPVQATNWELFMSLDLPGIVTILAAQLCYFLALEWGGITKPWDSADVIGTLVGWILLTIMFVLIQWRQQERALVVPRIIKQRTIAACSAFIFWWGLPWLPKTLVLTDPVSTRLASREITICQSTSKPSMAYLLLRAVSGVFQPFSRYVSSKSRPRSSNRRWATSRNNG